MLVLCLGRRGLCTDLLRTGYRACACIPSEYGGVPPLLQMVWKVKPVMTKKELNRLVNYKGVVLAIGKQEPGPPPPNPSILPEPLTPTRVSGFQGPTCPALNPRASCRCPPLYLSGQLDAVIPD